MLAKLPKSSRGLLASAVSSRWEEEREGEMDWVTWSGESCEKERGERGRGREEGEERRGNERNDVRSTHTHKTHSDRRLFRLLLCLSPGLSALLSTTVAAALH